MNILVLGAGGFIGGHLAKRLYEEGNTVIAIDIKEHEYWKKSEMCSFFIQGDLRDINVVAGAFSYLDHYDEVYQLAADMGGSGYIFTKENDADVMHNSALINLNVAHWAALTKVGRLFYSSSACVYPEYNQLDPNNPNCEEKSCIPAAPDSCYGWEKLFSEFLYDAYKRNYGLQVRIARFHNIFGPQGTWKGGKEKAPAAICRKVVEALEGPPKHFKKLSWQQQNGDYIQDIVDKDFIISESPIYQEGKKQSELTLIQGQHLEDFIIPGTIEIWGDGTATRSFLYIDECIEGVIRLMRSDCTEVVNIGSDEMISINDLARMVISISGKNLTINNIPGPTGVRGRNSHNSLIFKKLGWKPSSSLEQGMRLLYAWINQQVNNGS